MGKSTVASGATAGGQQIIPTDTVNGQINYLASPSLGGDALINRMVPSAMDQGLLTWAYDPAAAINSTVVTTGLLYLARTVVRSTVTVTNIVICVATAGVTLTAGQCFAGLFNSAGTLLAITADQSTSWQSTGAKTMALAAPVTASPGVYYVALLANGTTGPAIQRGVNSTVSNVGINAAPYRWSTGASGLTAIPSTVTLGGVTAYAQTLWVALS